MSSKRLDREVDDNHISTTPNASLSIPDDKPHTDNNNNNNSKSTTNNSDSLLTRIQNSATGLFQAAVTRPNGVGVSMDLANALNNNGKQSSSSSSSYAPVPTSYSSVSSSSSHSNKSWASSGSLSSLSHAVDDEAQSGLGASSFRSQTKAKDHGFELEPVEHDYSSSRDLFLGHTEDFFSNASERGDEKGKGKWKLNGEQQTSWFTDWDTFNQFDSAHYNEYEIAWINASRLGTIYNSSLSSSIPSPSYIEPSTEGSQHYIPQNHTRDGADVVDLLSDPLFQPELDYNDDNNYNNSSTDDDGYPIAITQSLTPSELAILDSFRRKLGDQSGQNQDQDQDRYQNQSRTITITTQSLIPDIDTFFTQNFYNDDAAAASGAKTDNADIRNIILTNLPGAEDWLHVHEQYHDEVWGYLRPALEDAAAELEKEREQGIENERDGPAVRRLKMILRHIREGH